MASLIEVLQDILGSLFIRDPKESEKRKQLRALSNELSQVSPPYFKRSTRQILPGFAQVLLEFIHLLKPVFELLQKTIDNEDSRLALRYKDYLLTSRLTETEQLRLEHFSYEAVKQRLLGALDPEGEFKAVQKEFREFLQRLEGPEFSAFEVEYGQVERLAALSRHDFDKLFCLFQQGFSLDQNERSPAFLAVSGEEGFPVLLDLYYLLGGRDLFQGLERNIAALLERLERTKASENLPKLKNLLLRAERLYKQNLNPELLQALIRLIKEDPLLKLQSEALEGGSHLEEFRNRLSAGFQRDCERIERESSESAVSQDIKALFGEAELLETEGYSEETANNLRERGFDSFLHIKALRILKSYLLARFEKELRDPVKKLLVEGFFENKILRLRPAYGEDRRLRGKPQGQRADLPGHHPEIPHPERPGQACFHDSQ